jgi:hypothetical protein
MWSFHKLEVTVTRGDVPEDSDEAGYVCNGKLQLIELIASTFQVRSYQHSFMTDTQAVGGYANTSSYNFKIVSFYFGV